MKWRYRDRLFLAYRCELIGTLLWAFVIEVFSAVALKLIAPELEGFTPQFSERTTAILGMIITGSTILFSLLAAPLITARSP